MRGERGVALEAIKKGEVERGGGTSDGNRRDIVRTCGFIMPKLMACVSLCIYRGEELG